MKKLFTIILLCIVTVASAQEYQVQGNSIVFSKVFENTGKSIEKTHKVLEALFAEIYNDVNSTEKLNQQDHFIYKGEFKKTGLYQLGCWTIDFPYTLDVAIKENRVRVQIIVSQGKYSPLCATKYSSSYYTIVEAAPFEVSKKNKFIKKESENSFNVLQRRCKELIHTIENGIYNSEVQNEDW